MTLVAQGLTKNLCSRSDTGNVGYKVEKPVEQRCVLSSLKVEGENTDGLRAYNTL